MRLNPLLLSSAVAVTITCLVSAAAYYYKRRNTEINEVMVFCKLQFNPHKYFDKLVSIIEGAKSSIHVCMPGIHNPVIQARLVNLIKSKNIKVRIIIDRSGYNASTDFFIKELIEAGAEIKFSANAPFNSMKHKFCLVDDKILMSGTLNWGDDRSFDHWNYVYITSKYLLVEPVKYEFYQIWKIASNIQTLFDICHSDPGTAEIHIPDKISDDSAAMGGDNEIVVIDNNNIATPCEKPMAQGDLNSSSMNPPLF